MTTTIDYLRQAYQQRQTALNTQFANTQRLAQEQITQANTQASGLAQEAWVGKKQQERTLPNVMAHAGLGGQGYTETTANAIGTAYQNAWNQIMTNKSNAINGINSNLMTAKSERDANENNINADWANTQANYYASLRSGSSGSNRSSNNGVTPPKEGTTANVEEYYAYFTTGQDQALGKVENWVSLTSQLNTALAKLVRDGKISSAQSNALWLRLMKYWEGVKYAGRDPVGGTGGTTGRTPTANNNYRTNAQRHNIDLLR